MPDLRNIVMEMDSHLTHAEGAADALGLVLDALRRTDESPALAYLAMRLEGHMGELRERWDRLPEMVAPSPKD